MSEGDDPLPPVPVELAQLKLAVDARLAQLAPAEPDVPTALRDAVRDALLAPAKRLRPMLTYLVAEPGPGESPAAIDAGCAVEMVHTASLILDDLPCMDDAVLRRQRPTTHVAYGQPTAILSSVALLSRAFGVLAQLPTGSAQTNARLASVLADAVGWNGLASGQQLDVDCGGDPSLRHQIERKSWLKTGVLFAAAAEIGAILRGLDPRHTHAVREFARHLGQAFQTFDDLKDRDATAAQAGKDVRKDDGKSTLITLLGPARAHDECRRHLDLAMSSLAGTGVSPQPIRRMLAQAFGGFEPSAPPPAASSRSTEAVTGDR